MLPTINPSNIVSTNSPSLFNQPTERLAVRQNNLIIYNIPETETLIKNAFHLKNIGY